MAFGTLSSLGFASGVLTQDTIDKLKENEEKSRLTPYANKLEENTNKKKDVTELLTKLSTFKSSVSSLGDASIFAKRKVESNVKENPAASLTAESGVALQSMNISVTQLAQKDVYQSKGLANDQGYVKANLTGSTTFTLFSNNKAYEIAVDSSMTYSDLVDKINQATDGEIVAKMINTGEKGSPYRLTLTTKETGEDNNISFYAGKKDNAGVYQTDTNAQDVLSNLGWELDTSTTIDPAKDKKGYGIKDNANDPLHIQVGQDAKFTLDGIKMTRSSNEISDIGVGLNLTLNKVGDINFDVKQDTSAATETMQSLVDAYNDLVVNLNASTDYNAETGTQGVLQGVSEITSIRSKINAALFGYQSVDGKVIDDRGNEVSAKVMVSLQDYGLSLNDSGNLSFDSSKFDAKMKEDPSFAESFFAGITEFEDINYKSNLIETNDIKNNILDKGGYTFNSGDFSILYNDKNYDFTRNPDGSSFVLNGASEKEIIQNLVNHINSFRIDGLTASFEEYDKNGQKGFNIKLKGESGSDLSIKGKDDVLKMFGMSETKIIAEPKEAKGIFAELKDVINSITGRNGSLTKYDEYLTTEKKSLDEGKESVQKMINSRYENMQNQFLQYELILNKLQTQLNTLTQMIQASTQQQNQ